MSVCFTVIGHDNLGDQQLEEVVVLKNQYWDYSMESQEKWIANHYKTGDIHVMAHQEGVLLAYASLTYQECDFDGGSITFLGLGNVCVDRNYRGHGYGESIIRHINDILVNRKITGLLLCHKELIPFYRKSDWHQIHAKEVTVEKNIFNDYVMGFNTDILSAGEINFPRNF